MKTSYNEDFVLKRAEEQEIDCRPKHIEANLCKKFKGSTEYKRQYIKLRKGEE